MKKFYALFLVIILFGIVSAVAYAMVDTKKEDQAPWFIGDDQGWVDATGNLIAKDVSEVNILFPTYQGVPSKSGIYVEFAGLMGRIPILDYRGCGNARDVKILWHERKYEWRIIYRLKSDKNYPSARYLADGNDEHVPWLYKDSPWFFSSNALPFPEEGMDTLATISFVPI